MEESTRTNMELNKDLPNEASSTETPITAVQDYKEYSVLKVLLAFVALYVIPVIVIVVFELLIESIDAVSDVLTIDFTSNVTKLFFVSFLTAPITLFLLLKMIRMNHSSAYLSFLAIKKIDYKTLIKWLLVTAVFMALGSLLDLFIDTPAEPFMFELEAAMNDNLSIVFIILSVCFLAPIMEEVIFRGWLYSELSLTKLNHIGIIVLTTALFTLIHIQYEHLYSFISIFLTGLLLGFIRYKSQNISYCIIIHVLFNFIAIIGLFIQ